MEEKVSDGLNLASVIVISVLFGIATFVSSKNIRAWRYPLTIGVFTSILVFLLYAIKLCKDKDTVTLDKPKKKLNLPNFEQIDFS